MEGQTKPKQFCVLVDGPVPEKLLSKFGHFGNMFEQLLRSNEQETWKFYFCMDGDIPSDEELSKYDAVIVSGSMYDAHGDYPWLHPLKQRLAATYNRKQKILGICFGHQLMAIVLGGKSGRAPVGLELGSVEVTLNKEFAQTWYGKMLNGGTNEQESTVQIAQVHFDQVSELPPGATLLATSKNTNFEMYSVGDTVLCMQGHPEFQVEFVKQIIEFKRGESFPEKFVPDAIASLDNKPPSYKILKQICQTFIHGQ